MWTGCCFSIIYNHTKAVSEYVCVSLFASSMQLSKSQHKITTSVCFYLTFLLCSRFKLSGEVLSKPRITSNMYVLCSHIWTPSLLKLNTVWSNNKIAEARELDDKINAWCKYIWTWQAYPTHWQKKQKKTASALHFIRPTTLPLPPQAMGSAWCVFHPFSLWERQPIKQQRET